MFIRYFVLGVVSLLATHIWAANPYVIEMNESFETYQARVKLYLLANKEWVNPDNKEVEVEAVLPKEWRPGTDCDTEEKVKRGVLLLHGLSDSPYSVRDTAKALAAQCLYVRVMLLPGHGTKQEDLLTVSRDDWRETVKASFAHFSAKLDQVFVAGFSTGGALVTEFAWHNPDKVSGVILLSPLFKINTSIDWLSPVVSLFTDWLDRYKTDDYAKYASIPTPAIVEAYRIAKEVRGLVHDNPKDIPVFIALSEEDATVDSSVTLTLFDEAMIGNTNQVLLYSRTQAEAQSDRKAVVNTYWPDQKIIGLSHMGVIGNPNNTYYGEKGSYRICDWHRSDDAQYKKCQRAENNWYGEKSDELLAKSDIAGRVSWNPLFDDLMKDIGSFISAHSAY
ncbi:alpha/beta hydrolase [Marinomonas mediterranea]|uniref:Carboxylesterase n=1 Tax=Marinomonas mediterranea (strain ATCC 700492 / JCM 21426 / NBRC 103028 / MMB-1) TaxID=717774 RepID=F2JX05_MARM1|nr:alpha/beta fold hydrolase [Marinomonas mediterranea]ADZ89524.1 carboxylesterase [Marinomonas mediterranea MMB-1]